MIFRKRQDKLCSNYREKCREHFYGVRSGGGGGVRGEG
jgi:hypothetical protein